MTIDAILARCRVMPVIVLEELAHAVPLARALVAGGLPVLEVTLRTPVALDGLRAIRREVPGAVVGAGTITSPADLDAAMDAGASFGVSPGATPALLAHARTRGLPFLPGVMTPSEVVQALAHGFSALKFFPAEAAGGIRMLKSLAGPFPAVRFCPTGGIDAANAAAYLALPNVACVGGSWVAPAALVRAGDWAGITALARGAAA